MISKEVGLLISFSQKGDFSRTTKYLNRIKNPSKLTVYDKYGQAGVSALKSATPVDSGKTASSWYYKVEKNSEMTSIVFCNSNINDNVPIAIILQYGHGTGTGGYVQGRDYINPAIRPVFDGLAEAAWKEVTRV